MIYLIRHGLDDEKYIGGWSDVDLIKDGISQIKESRKFIVDKGLVINKIISSDIKRARTTCEIINEVLNINVIYSDKLRELDKGDYTGVLKNSLSKNELKRINNFSIYDKYPNGESMLDLYCRMKCYLDDLKKFDNVLLVTHRGVINMFYYLINNVNLDMDKEKFGVIHGSVHELDIKKKLIRRIF